VPRSIRVVSEDLQVSAAKVDLHADEVQLRHTAADGRIEAAQVGVPAGSSVALSAAVAKWQADTTALFGRLVDHGGALRAAVAGYEQTEERSATEINAVGGHATAVDLGL
jgi:uncharacterized protein YukE